LASAYREYADGFLALLHVFDSDPPGTYPSSYQQKKTWVSRFFGYCPGSIGFLAPSFVLLLVVADW